MLLYPDRSQLDIGSPQPIYTAVLDKNLLWSGMRPWAGCAEHILYTAHDDYSILIPMQQKYCPCGLTEINNFLFFFCKVHRSYGKYSQDLFQATLLLLTVQVPPISAGKTKAQSLWARTQASTRWGMWASILLCRGTITTKTTSKSTSKKQPTYVELNFSIFPLQGQISRKNTDSNRLVTFPSTR